MRLSVRLVGAAPLAGGGGGAGVGGLKEERKKKKKEKQQLDMNACVSKQTNQRAVMFGGGGRDLGPLRLSGLTPRLNPTAQGLDAHRWAAVLSGPSSDSLISCIFFFF